MSLTSVKIGEQNEHACGQFFASLGCVVYSTRSPGVEKGKRKIRGTMRTPGTPDFLVFHEPTATFFFWEAKAGKAVLTKEQREFERLVKCCLATLPIGRVFPSPVYPFGVGDLDAAKRFAAELGICEYDERTGFVQRKVG